jgi:hypothetical protein
VTASLVAVAVAAASMDAAIDALRNDDSLKVRTQAAIILGQRGVRAAIPALREAATRDDSAAVRIAAVSALARLKARAARPTLIALRDTDPDDGVRAAATRALAALGGTTVRVEEPTGTASARESVRAGLTARLRERGFVVADAGEIRLKPKVIVDVSNGAISVELSVVVVDADNHLDMVDGSARAHFTGTLPEARLAATSAKVVDAALQGVLQNLVAKLGGR